MKDTLNKILKNKTICELYSDLENTDKFMVGYVLALGENSCLIFRLDFYGKYDGISYLLLDDIFNIQTETKYLKTIEKLAKTNGVSLTEFQINNDLLTTMASEIHRKKRICTIHLCGSSYDDVTGFITDFELEKKILNCV